MIFDMIQMIPEILKMVHFRLACFDDLTSLSTRLFAARNSSSQSAKAIELSSASPVGIATERFVQGDKRRYH